MSALMDVTPTVIFFSYMVDGLNTRWMWGCFLAMKGALSLTAYTVIKEREPMVIAWIFGEIGYLVTSGESGD